MSISSDEKLIAFVDNQSNKIIIIEIQKIQNRKNICINIENTNLCNTIAFSSDCSKIIAGCYFYCFFIVNK